MSRASQHVTPRHMSRPVVDQSSVTSVTHSYKSVTAVTVIRDGLDMVPMPPFHSRGGTGVRGYAFALCFVITLPPLILVLSQSTRHSLATISRKRQFPCKPKKECRKQYAGIANFFIARQSFEGIVASTLKKKPRNFPLFCAIIVRHFRERVGFTPFTRLHQRSRLRVIIAIKLFYATVYKRAFAHQFFRIFESRNTACAITKYKLALGGRHAQYPTYRSVSPSFMHHLSLLKSKGSVA
jgi:hypothetical protein